MSSRFGMQPARKSLADQRWSIAKAAAQLGVEDLHLGSTLYGRTAPSQIVRDRLPALLGVPLPDLFTAEALAATYNSHKGPGNRAKRAAWSNGGGSNA